MNKSLGGKTPRGGGDEVETLRYRGGLEVGFGVHLGCESDEVKPKKA